MQKVHWFITVKYRMCNVRSQYQQVCEYSSDTLCAKKHSLYFVCFAIGSQCNSSKSHGLMSLSRTVCTATCTALLCNAASVDAGKPAIIALQWSRCDGTRAVTSLVLLSCQLMMNWVQTVQVTKHMRQMCKSPRCGLLEWLDDILTRLSDDGRRSWDVGTDQSNSS